MCAQQTVSDCQCCDICTQLCNCTIDCPKSTQYHSVPVALVTNNGEMRIATRNAPSYKKVLLKGKLRLLHDKMINKSNQLKSVYYPSTLFEFSNYQIKQILHSCAKTNFIEKYFKTCWDMENCSWKTCFEDPVWSFDDRSFELDNLSDDAPDTEMLLVD